MQSITRSVTGLLAGVGLAILAGAASAQTYAPLGATPSTQALGAALDAATAPVTPSLTALRSALNAGTAAQTTAGLGQLTPSSYASLTEIGRIGNDNDQRVISNHLSLLRSGEVSASGVFTEGALNVGRYPTQVDRPSAEINLSSIVLGGDATVGAVSFGGMLTYRDATDRLDRQYGHASLTGYGSNMFVTTRFGEGMFLDAMLGASKGDLDLRRNATIGALASNQTASTKLRTINAGLRLGKTMDLTGAQLEPFVGLRYGETRIDRFDETGGPAAVGVYDQSQDSLQSDLGLRLSGGFQSGGATLRPELRATWTHEFKYDPVSFNYALAAVGPGGIAYTTGPGRDKNLAELGLGLSVNGIGGGVFRVDYDGKVGKNKSQTQQAVSMGARFPF